MKLSTIISKNVIHCEDEDSIDTVIRKMKENEVSCVLIVDKQELVVGIVTERDILRNLATVELDKKLERPIRVLMSRSVSYVERGNIEKGIWELYQTKKVRHFPVLHANIRLKDRHFLKDVEGIITTTDVFVSAIRRLANK